MSWGYWGIVTGVVFLIGVFFYSVALLYAGVNQSRQGGRQNDEPGKRDKEPVGRAA
jgi:hypothetical protein